MSNFELLGIDKYMLDYLCLTEVQRKMVIAALEHAYTRGRLDQMKDVLEKTYATRSRLGYDTPRPA